MLDTQDLNTPGLHPQGLSTQGADSLDGPRPSLRERKKLATRRALQKVALDLVAQRGYAHVTVEDIAEAAEVSPRTFFNYFPSKEAAFLGTDPERTEALRQRLVNEAPEKSAIEALRAVLVAEVRGLSEELAEVGGTGSDWICRMKAAQVDPHLRAAQASHMTMVEHAITSGLAERLGTDPRYDPYPAVLASAALGAIRAVVSFWARSGETVALDILTDAALDALTKGLPEDSELRRIVSGKEHDREKGFSK